MPDRYGDTSPDDWPDVPPPNHMPDELYAAETRALAIVNCGLCDDDGYRGLLVCDHVDYRETAKRGSALVRAELEKIQQRKASRR